MNTNESKALADCRGAFDRWCQDNLDRTAKVPEDVVVIIVDGLWEGWKAAWKTALESQPVAGTVGLETIEETFDDAVDCLFNREQWGEIAKGMKAIHALQLPAAPVAGQVIGEALKSIKADLKEALTIDDKKHFERQIRSALWTAEEALRTAQQPQAQGVEVVSVFDEVIAELDRAMSKFPTWPTDPIHAVAVLGEEFGELTQAVLQSTYEPAKSNPEEVRKEAIQTAAMAIRFLASLDKYEYQAGKQHEQEALLTLKGGR